MYFLYLFFWSWSSVFNVNLPVSRYQHVFVFCPSSAESAGISTALRQVANFLDQVLSLCNRLELCILWYMVHNMPFKDATAVTVWINILFIDRAHCHFPMPSPKSFTIVISCFSLSDICDQSCLILFYPHFLYVVLTLWTMLFCFPLTTLHCFI